MAIIEMIHVSKEYKLGNQTGLKHSIRNALRRMAGKKAIGEVRFKALNDVSLEIEPGEVIGIIGANGAGKSTLLKHLVNIVTPTQGKVHVRGSVAPLIEVGAGVNPELTGRENIFLNAAILGIPKKQIKQKLDEIIAFSELEQFIDTPVKRYSTGMILKLGFSIATSLNADILIIDEVLAVGDMAFQRKCFDRMEDMIKNQGKTVVLISHNIRQIERICERVLLLEKGSIIAEGPAKNVCDFYYQKQDEQIQSNLKAAHLAKNDFLANDLVSLIDFALFDASGKKQDCISYGAKLTVEISLKVKQRLIHPILALGIHTADCLYLCTQRSLDTDFPNSLMPGFHLIRCHIDSFPFLPGVYAWRISVTSGLVASTILYAENIMPFKVQSADFHRSMIASEGFISMPVGWEHEGKRAS